MFGVVVSKRIMSCCIESTRAIYGLMPSWSWTTKDGDFYRILMWVGTRRQAFDPLEHVRPMIYSICSIVSL